MQKDEENVKRQTLFPLEFDANKMKIIRKENDPDVIRTRSLLIWSQTRYRCATESHLM